MSFGRSVLLLASALSTVVALAGRGGAADGAMVRVDIFRPESKGLMNSIACIITIPAGGSCHPVIRGEANKSISGGAGTVLLGGDRVVCEIRPGGSIQAFTPRALRPEGDTPDARSWTAATLAPHARPGDTVEVGVVPKSRASSHLAGWVLRQEAHAATAKRATR